MKFKPFWKGLNKQQYELIKSNQLSVLLEFFSLLIVGIFEVRLVYVGLWLYLIGNLVIYHLLFNEQTSKEVKNE